MPLINGKELLNHAKKGEYAIPAFGFVNLEEAKAIVHSAEELNAPIILQTTQGGIDYGGHNELAAIAISLAKRAKIPIVLHLDHGRNLKYHRDSLKLGYTSLMIDGSLLSFAENVAITKEVVNLIKDEAITVEAELGIIGGKEDDLVAEEDGYTDLDEAIKFVQETKIDMLAIACGTTHGFYRKIPQINFPLIMEISQKANISIVLHGGSDIPIGEIRKAAEIGVKKINFDSELKKVFIEGIMNYMREKPDSYDIRKIFAPGIQNIENLVKEKILACGAKGKNWL